MHDRMHLIHQVTRIGLYYAFYTGSYHVFQRHGWVSRVLGEDDQTRAKTLAFLSTCCAIFLHSSLSQSGPQTSQPACVRTDRPGSK